MKKHKKARKRKYEITHICLECKAMYAFNSGVVLSDAETCPKCFGTIAPMRVIESSFKKVKS